MQSTKFIILAVLDGWGLASQGAGNAISRTPTPNMDSLWASYPHTQLGASGESVGLPRGEVGSTETGHLNLGAGRIVYQELARINMSIADGVFFNNKILLEAIAHTKKNDANLHLMGLVGAGGVHSNMEHLFALITLAAKHEVKKVYLHLFTDGRDSAPTSAKTYVSRLREVIKEEGVGEIASIMGRYWSMDRDLRWERTKKAYEALTAGKGHLVKTPEEAIDTSYFQGKTDEFIEPSIVVDSKGAPIATIKANDAVIFFNFRIDRPRQLTKAFVSKDFRSGKMEWDFDPYAVKYEKKHMPQKKNSGQVFDRGESIENLHFVMMTQYGKPLEKEGAKVAFKPEQVDMPLGRVISDANKRQLRMSESEKERFVTFYFNGQSDIVFRGEERLITPSPKVPTYDQKPEMSAQEMTTKLLAKIKDTSPYSFILINYANADMVGHSGNIGAAATALKTVDESIGRIVNYILAYEATLLITADHGNVEEMIKASTGRIDTEHSGNPVPFIAVSKKLLNVSNKNLQEGILADIAPTILGLLGINQPVVMTGRNLLAGLTFG